MTNQADGASTMQKAQERGTADRQQGGGPAVDASGPHPLVQLVLSRLREFLREPEAIFWVYGFPILMTVLLGIAFRSRPQDTYRVDVQASAEAGIVAAALGGQATAETQRRERATSAGSSSRESVDSTGEEGAPPRPRFEVDIVSAEQARRRLRSGKTAIVVVAAAGTKQSATLADLSLEYVYDPTRPDSAAARAAVDDALQRAAGRHDLVRCADVAVTEPGARYIDFLIPGLLGMSLMGGGLWGIGFVTVDMRVRNLLKRLVATPMKKAHFLGGMAISRFFFMVTEVLVILLCAWLFFGVAVRGSLLTLVFLVVLGAWTFAGIGLLVASRARTIETVSGLMNLVMLPMWLLSGIFFSYERFPAAAHPFIKALPLTPLNDALRAVMIEGASLANVGLEVGILLAWGATTFALALRLFRWY